MAVARTYDAGQIIRMEAAPLAFYANMVSGVAKMFKSTPDGRQQIVGLLFPGYFIDNVFAKKATCSVEAVSKVRLNAFPKKPFEKFVRNDPDLEHRLLTMALHDLEEAQEWMLLLGRKTAREKVATFLYMLASRKIHLPCPHTLADRLAGKEGEIVFDIPLVRSDIADYLGLTMETVCRQMTNLRKDGVVGLPDNHSFTVKDFDRLALEAGQTTSFEI